MTRTLRPRLPAHRLYGSAGLAALLAVAGCASASQTASSVPQPSMAMAMEHTLPATDGPGFTGADVRFMQGMIPHHAQAIEMARMAGTHGAGQRVLQLALKIDISQRDEIKFMQRWLAERKQAVPDSAHLHMMVMPGMLTPAQLAELERARGTAFDKLFLAFMIQHHEGALAMVKDLLASPRAAEDSDIFRFVTDVEADQSAEIDVMSAMLEAISGSSLR
jgi:uncharacterized protein (DUF305 family)